MVSVTLTCFNWLHVLGAEAVAVAGGGHDNPGQLQPAEVQGEATHPLPRQLLRQTLDTTLPVTFLGVDLHQVALEILQHDLQTLVDLGGCG